MFAIFHHYTQWSWDNLPKELTESVHMTLDTPTCMDDTMSSNNATDINTLASYPGPLRGRRKGLVHTDCACVVNHPESG